MGAIVVSNTVLGRLVHGNSLGVAAAAFGARRSLVTGALVKMKFGRYREGLYG